MVSDKVKSRFWAKVQKSSGDGCWIWLGARQGSGHGIATMPSRNGQPKRNTGAHRMAWEIATGDDPGQWYVCHRCDNPTCVRPDHLFLGTQADNLADMRAKGRQAKGETHGMRLHPEASARGERNAASKLTWEKVRAIRSRAANGERSSVLAEEYGVWPETINAIKRHALWKEVAA